ncbi:MAG: hypothetical protein EZS28_039842 [Streblomastix strix]|uniref:Uncharacterized protein n=1 Tax=Streblomastix strix TaxID=222440 RepID=A0A5J4U3P6_9EUKA|nr:MAG: hypothetical protein EZS28_039842 [Streblomastix strix]
MISKRVQLKERVYLLHTITSKTTEALTAGSQIVISFVIPSLSYIKKFVVHTSEIIKEVRARGITNLDEIGLYADGGTKVAKSIGKKRTVGAIKKADTEHISLALSVSCGQSENTEDNSYKSNAMSLDDCSFAEEQQFENDEKIMDQGSSNDSDEEKDDDTKAMKNLGKSQNKHIVNNQAGDDYGPILEATGREHRRQIYVSLPSGQSFSLNSGQQLRIDLGFVNGNQYVTIATQNKE